MQRPEIQALSLRDACCGVGAALYVCRDLGAPGPSPPGERWSLAGTLRPSRALLPAASLQQGL